uniref:Protein RDM1 n=1 Tax=Kalanchoe fedtschenkoi TaxID=63787 RepID=A0A7N0TEV1_KALFE
MKRSVPWNEQVDVISSDSSSADAAQEAKVEHEEVQSMATDQPADEVVSEGLLLRRAEIYQNFMMSIKIPNRRGSLVPCNTWMGLGKSLKQLYGQPLHYLTNVRLKELDKLRIGTYDEYKPLDAIIHPIKAEASIWLTEEIHRISTSPHHLAKLWASDPLYHACIDSIIPQWSKELN